MHNYISFGNRRKRINIIFLKWMILILPFFEPLSIDSAISSGIDVNVFSKLALVYTVLRLIVATYIYLNYFYQITRHKNAHNSIAICLILFIIFRVISNVINDYVSINMIIGAYSYIAFVILCLTMVQKSPRDFVKAVLALFAIFSFWDIVFIFIYNNGFNYATDKAYALYLLGSKNASFMYFYVFLLALIVYCLFIDYKKRKYFLPCIILMLIAVLICQSGNSIVCLGIILFAYFIYTLFPGILSKINIVHLLIGNLIIIVMVYTEVSLSIFSKILSVLQKDTTYNGRDYLWKTALLYFASSPILGKGENISFFLKIGIEQSHAHSQYLDQLAKFGIVGLSFFFATIINVGKVLFTINCDKSKTGLLGVMLFVFLLHMTFDVTTTYFITLIPMIFYSVKLLDKENAKPTVYSEYFG